MKKLNYLAFNDFFLTRHTTVTRHTYTKSHQRVIVSSNDQIRFSSITSDLPSDYFFPLIKPPSNLVFIAADFRPQDIRPKFDNANIFVLR